jgi:hypothetical protein
VLRKLLKSKKESIRLGSCRAMLEFGVRLRETIELQRRLESLEETGPSVHRTRGKSMNLKVRLSQAESMLRQRTQRIGCPGCKPR